jgi:predicted metalloprotease with PDZ domain
MSSAKNGDFTVNGKILRRLAQITAIAIVCCAPLPAQTTPSSSKTIRLTVDARQAAMKIIHTKMEMPVSAGPLTLYYPKWIPGMHEPTGPIANVTGLKFVAGGNAIPWRRDLRDVYTFHVDVPAGVSQLDVSFDYIDAGGAGGSSTTDKLMVLNWYAVLLYPAGVPASQITFAPSLTLPSNWSWGSALKGFSVTKFAGAGNFYTFDSVALDRLADSPLVAGEYYRAIDLTPPGEPIHHEIDIVADSEAALAMPEDVKRGLTNLVAETGKLFGARHYKEYHFLLTLSDHTAHFGVEHHESNDSRLPERIFLSPTAAREVGGLLAHEFAHSWSGKFCRPRNLATPEYETPMETDLLWVYEGNTSYLGDILATRSGMWSPDDYRQNLAGIAASLGPGRPGRTWRPLLDTAAAVPGMFGGAGWNNWRRGSDYYEEGEMIWIEVANIINRLSHGTKSFEDFARAFYGGPNNGAEVKPYTFEELVQTLNQTVAFNWESFLNARLLSTSADAPVAGIESSGWKVVFTSDPPGGARGLRGVSAATYSLGLNLAADGTVSDSFYGGVAFTAGITSGMKVVAVNGRAYKPEYLSDAIKASKTSQKAIELLVVADEYYKTVTINYHDGEKYPHLIRDAAKPDYLAEMLKPLPRN